MASVKTEGTFRLEGLLEGPILSSDDEEIINNLIKQAHEEGLIFHAAINNGRFSLLADTEPVNIKPTDKSPDLRVIKYLKDFLGNYSPRECINLMSTLRSVEYIPGNEIQTIYCIKPDCTVSAEQRIVRAETISPAQPIELKQTIKFAIPLILALCAGIGISAFFIPYRDIAKNIISDFTPFDVNNVTIDTENFSKFFQVETIEADETKEIIQIIFKVSESYPDTEQKLNYLWNSPEISLSQKLALEALARNNISCIFYDSDGKFSGQMNCYMQWIEENNKLFGIVIPFNKDLRKIQITY